MLILNTASVALYNSLRSHIIDTYAKLNASDTQAILNYYTMFKKEIEQLDSSNDEPTEHEIDAGHTAILHDVNIKHQRQAMQRQATTTITQEPAEAMTTTTVTTNSFDIESMNLQELAELQLKIAQRMNALLAAPQVEVASIEPTNAEPTEYGVEIVEPAPKANRVKKASKPAEQATTPKTVEPALPDTASPESSDVSAMSYKELQQFISAKTKACAGAKAQAQKVAREYGAKSWSTTGRKGYEEIYKLITK